MTTGNVYVVASMLLHCIFEQVTSISYPPVCLVFIFLYTRHELLATVTFVDVLIP